MNKKVAIMVGGMLREFETAHKSWSFLNCDSRDVFFSTWNTTYEINEPLNINIKEEVTDNHIKKYISDAYVKLSEDIIFDLTTVTSIKKIIYHWKVLLKMVKDTGNFYNIAILTRPDFYLKENVNLVEFIEKISDDSVYGLTKVDILNKPPYLYIQDCFFIAKFSIIEKMINTFELDPEFNDIHVYLSKYFVENKINVIRIEPNILEYYVCRSIHRSTAHISFEKNKEIGLNWWRIKNIGEDPTPLLKFLKNV